MALTGNIKGPTGLVANYTVTALKSASTAPDLVFITDSGKEGLWKRDLTDTTSTDNVGGVMVDNLGKRWKRQFEKEINSRWFGAKLDGSTVDYSAIQLANSLGFSIVFENGTAVINSDIIFNKPVILKNAVLKSSANITFNGFESDFKQCLDITGNVLFKNVEKINAVWFGVDGNSKGNGVSTTSGSNTVTTQQLNTFLVGDVVKIVNAGVGGTTLTATITAISGNTLTLSSSCSITNVITSIYTFDNSTALNRFAKALQLSIDASSPNTGNIYGACVGYIPRGVYACLSKVNIYSGCKIIGDYSNVLGGTILLQTNIDTPIFNVIANNFSLTNGEAGGNGNNVFKDLIFKSAFINDNNENASCVYFQNAYNTHSDTEFDHVLFQNTAGYCTEAGFKTTGTGTAGSNTLILGDGSTFRSTGSNVGGSQITIKGAGTAGSDLVTYIVSGGGTNNVVLATNILTSVTNAVVYPTNETFHPLKINNCELDVCRGGFKFVNNISGNIVINNLMAYQVIRGVLYIETELNFFSKIYNSVFDACGNPFEPNQARRYSFFVRSKNVKSGDFIVSNCDFRKVLTFGSGFRINNLSNVIIKDCYFEDCDNNDLAKFMFLIENDFVIFDKNIIKSNAINNYTNSRFIVVSNGGAYSHISVSENTFINKNAGSVDNFIYSDYLTNNDKFLNNTFIGNVNSKTSQNVSNVAVRNRYTEDNIVKYASTFPTSGTWVKGDRIINNNPTVGQPKAWICTVSGTSGTWVSEGNL